MHRSGTESMGLRASKIEALEGRTLFASAALSSAGVLTINGAASAGNTITVVESADGTKLSVAIAATAGSAAVSKIFVTTKVKKIVVNGGSAADRILVGQTGHTLVIPTVVWAKAGSDTIKTGGGQDVIHAGKGNDTVYGGAGKDVVFGFEGDDLIYGGANNDTLWGGHGKDKIYGEAGDDFLGGYLGVNSGYGGAGKDTFYVAKTLAGSFSVNDFVVGTDVLKVGAEPTAE